MSNYPIRENAAKICERKAAHVRSNADALKRFGFTEAVDEARCRQLAALFLDEVAEELRDFPRLEPLRRLAEIRRVTWTHDGEYCKDDEDGQSVCEGTYGQRTDEVLGLVEALQAISALCAGYDDQSQAITKIINDAISEHAAWTE